VIIGGLGPRGVVATASYEARVFGVHSALPMARARRLCPGGVFLAPRFDAYADASRAVMEILRSFTPLVEPIASDEAFLDVAGARRLHGTGPECATAIRSRIHAETGLTASVGVATTKLVAKLASDDAKPDGVLIIEPGTELDLLHPLSVRRLWGVGPATERRLAILGVRTIGDLAAIGETRLIHALGDASGRHLYALAWNRDDRAVVANRERKSVGHEETFPVDVTERAELGVAVLRMSGEVARRLRSASRRGRTVQLKVRYSDFRTITRSRTLAGPTDLAAEIARVAHELLDGVSLDEGIRLLGVSAQQLVEPATGTPGAGSPGAGRVEQPDLFTPVAVAAESVDPRPADLERSLDAVRARFGDAAVGPVSTRVGSHPAVRDNG
jgi:DNA polymerase-4